LKTLNKCSCKPTKKHPKNGETATKLYKTHPNRQKKLHLFASSQLSPMTRGTISKNVALDPAPQPDPLDGTPQLLQKTDLQSECGSDVQGVTFGVFC
jgi:hypothetical protein